MRELIEQRDFGNVVYQRSVFVDQDGFVISIGDWKPTTTEWQPINSNVGGSQPIGGVCGFNNGIIIR